MEVSPGKLISLQRENKQPPGFRAATPVQVYPPDQDQVKGGM